ncbi:MAG TPA: effector binding domain-containing protein [Rhabdochlamydiaceae bacterium]|nr:effector binding domain-containing protein [Rhabdochlamydiaceae bacterium]HSX13399.1 effector binding domain-containing protein [Chlamydiales bacterium]
MIKKWVLSIPFLSASVCPFMEAAVEKPELAPQADCKLIQNHSSHGVTMQQTSIAKPEIKLVGICVQTSYQQESDKMKGNIFPCVQRYFHQALFEKIPHRTKPGTTFCAYTDYENDYKGAYTYFIGEEVSSFDTSLPEGFEKLIIPEQQYAKFTTNPAPMPDVIVNAWQTILEMPPTKLGGKRRYQTDFEIYDERAADHQNIVLDLYVGIEKMDKMEYVKKQDAIKHENSPNCIVYEYPMANSDMNIAVAEITHRYPDQGYSINHKCTEMAYVLKGSGKLVTETQAINLSVGDAVLIPQDEKYYWEGNLTVVLPCAPAWYPEQHETIVDGTSTVHSNSN